MKRFGRKQQLLNVSVVISLTVLLLAVGAVAQAGAPLEAGVTFLKASYNLDDPNEKISAVITITNVSPDYYVLAPYGFGESEYHLDLIIQGPGPEGPIITGISTESSSPTPSIPPAKVRAERLDSGWFINMPIDELRYYYSLTEPGEYRVWFTRPFAQYDPAQAEPEDVDGDGIDDWYLVPYTAVIWNDPLESDPPVTITLTKPTPQVSSDVRITGTVLSFGEGDRPGMTKKPLTGIEVRIYKTSDCEAWGITKFNFTTYSRIATNSHIPYLPAEPTTIAGEYLCKEVGQSEYIIIGYANADTAYRHIGGAAIIKTDDANWGEGEIVRNLILMTDMRGRKAPAKIKEIKGSKLTIIEPEYIEWDDNQAFYPFAFVTEEDWEVEISVKPPKGFEIDKKSLKETVSAESRAIQFTLTDEGGEWVPSKVKYKAKHKKTTKEVESEIGVKLTKKLAKEKDLTVWGEEKDKDKDKDK